MKFIKEPQTSGDKIKLTRKLLKEFEKLKNKKKEDNWQEGEILYYFDKYNLYKFLSNQRLSKFACWKEMDIPPSTAQFKISLYGFYIAKHNFTLKELKGANTKKLHRAIPILKNLTKDEAKEAVRLAKNRDATLEDYLALCRF